NESPGKAFDSEGAEVIGTDMELDIEARAAAEPDILVAYGNEKGDGWTWWDETVTSQVAELAGFVPVKLGQSPDAMFAQYAAIARALGKDTETGGIADKRTAYEDARERIREVTAKKDGLTVLLANFSAEMNYTSKTSGIAEMLREDGLELVGPDSSDDSSWQRCRGRRCPTTPPMSSSSTTPRPTSRTTPSTRASPPSGRGSSGPGMTSAPTPTTATPPGSANSPRCSMGPRRSSRSEIRSASRRAR